MQNYADEASMQMHSCMTLYAVPFAAGQVLARQCCELGRRHLVCEEDHDSSAGTSTH